MWNDLKIDEGSLWFINMIWINFYYIGCIISVFFNYVMFIKIGWCCGNWVIFLFLFVIVVLVSWFVDFCIINGWGWCYYFWIMWFIL